MTLSFETVQTKIAEWLEVISQWAVSPQFYMQLIAIFAAIVAAKIIAGVIKNRMAVFRDAPVAGTRYAMLRTFFHQCGDMLFPLLLILLLSVAIEVCIATLGQGWVVRIAQSLAVVFLLFNIIKRFVKDSFINGLFRWVGIPLATLHVFGWLDEVTGFLDGISLSVGNINLTAYALARTLIFGSVLFWLGRISNTAGQQVIRNQANLDTGTREVFAKLFEILLFIVLFLLLLQIVGINLTTLAVFGGALGVGLGFGLQQIAANFISGIIILLDRSLKVGDHLELEDGRTGILRELNMRSAALQTFDGKTIMVPNEQFITTAFTNWTHKNQKQRYDLEFSVAYSTDLHKMIDIVKTTVASHPQVLSGEGVSIEEQPDAEISGFGDSGINILVEFWMEGIDDGENRVGADLLMMIWDAFQEHGIQIPFPQREVRLLDQSA